MPRSFAITNGVAVFLSEPIQVVAPEHTSHPLLPDYEAILRAGDDFVLNIGAGATVHRYPNCIEFENKIFRHTDVVGQPMQKRVAAGFELIAKKPDRIGA